MGFLKTERPLKSTLSLIWKTAIAIVGISILWSMGIVGLIVAFFIVPSFLNKLEAKIAKGREIDTVPYWGRIFGLKQTIKLLSADKLKPYKLKDGTFCHKLMITESGRWFFVRCRWDGVCSASALLMIRWFTKRFLHRALCHAILSVVLIL